MTINFGIRMLSSITLFIVLCSAFFVSVEEKNRAEKISYGIDVTFAHKNRSPFESDSINKSRTWKIIILTSDQNANQRALSMGEEELERIKENFDTINGIQFLLDSTASYQTFIEAIDICMKQNPAWVIPDGNKVLGYYSNANPNYWRRDPLNRQWNVERPEYIR